MVDNYGLPGNYGANAGRDAYVAGRDINVHYVTYNGTWSDGVAQPPLMADSGGVTAPYRGLSPFQEEDADLFFGRERATRKLLEVMSERLDRSGLVVVSGVSGAGKSSLLRAGILPTLRSEGLAAVPSAGSWPRLLLTPSDGPLNDLADGVATMLRFPAIALRTELAVAPSNFATIASQAALTVSQDGSVDASQANEGRRLMLVVDQCEKLFTQCNEEARHAFLMALYAATAGGRAKGKSPVALVVLAIRADFDARLAEYRPEEFPELGVAVENRFLLRAMTGGELRLAITGPPEKAGSHVGEPLVQALLAEMHAQTTADGPVGQAIGAGALPLLSHALDQAWAARTGPDLELADYERVGGIQGAVAVTAEDVYARLSVAQQQAARTVFTRMIATSSDGTDTAIRLPVTDLLSGQEPGTAADVAAVLEAFAARRLLTMAAGTVEISHESLLTAWPLLRDTWLAENHADRIVRTRLLATASEWARESQNPSFLYRGSLLQEATDTAARVSADPIRNPPLTGKERDFLAASTRASHSASRRRRTVTVGLAALTLVATALAGVAFYTAGVAADNAANATRQQDIELSRLLAADSLTADQANPVAARRLAVAAWRVYPTDQAKAAMLTLVAEQQQGTLPVTVNGSVNSVAFSPNGKLLATADSNGYVRLWNPVTRQPAGSAIPADTEGARIGVSGVVFSPDGRLLATADADGRARVWNATSGKLVATLNADTSGTYIGVTRVAFSPNGKFLATADFNGLAQIWDAVNARPIKSVFVNGPPTGVTFSPNGETIAIAVAEGGSAQLWNLAKGTLTATSKGESVEGVAFSPNGKLLAVAGYDGNARILDTASGKFIATFAADTGGDSTGVFGVAFSPDGKTLATADKDNVARLWSLAGVGAVSTIPAGQASMGGIVGLAFSPNGQMLATTDLNGYARIWRTVNGKPIAAFAADATGDSVGVYGVAFSPDGELLATADADGTARLWNTANGKLVATLNVVTRNSVNGVAFSPDGKLLATADDNGYVRLWNSATGQPVGRPIPADITGSEIGATGVAFSPNGKVLATADMDGTAKLLDVASGKQITSVSVAPPGGTFVAFSPGGKLLATAGSNDNSAQLWNVATSQPVGNPLADSASAFTGVAGVTFSSDGKLLATADNDGTAQLWDTATGQLIVSYHTSDQGVNGIAFSPNGTLLGTAGANGIVQLWRTPLSLDPYRTLCSEFGPPTQGEWAQYAAGESLPDVC